MRDAPGTSSSSAIARLPPPETAKTTFTFPGEGDGDVRRIVKDLLASGYEGGLSIEPHLSVVQHDQSVVSTEEQKYNNYVEYGHRMERMVASTKEELRGE